MSTLQFKCYFFKGKEDFYYSAYRVAKKREYASPNVGRNQKGTYLEMQDWNRKVLAEEMEKATPPFHVLYAPSSRKGGKGGGQTVEKCSSLGWS